MSNIPTKDEFETARCRFFQVTSIMELVEKQLNGVSGDEEAMEVAELTNTLSIALRGAQTLANAILEDFEHLRNRLPEAKEAQS